MGVYDSTLICWDPCAYWYLSKFNLSIDIIYVFLVWNSCFYNDWLKLIHAKTLMRWDTRRVTS